jgi:lipid-A-disaccharide synthase
VTVAAGTSRSSSVTIGIVAGEASGDALAATLIRAVKERVPQARFVGIAGPRMEAAGCEAWYPLEMLSVRGFVEVISRLPQLVVLRRALYRVCAPSGCRCSSASTRRTSIWGSSGS